MNTQDIEKEIQARVKFKMSELLTGIKNRVHFKWKQAFDMTRESQYAWEAFKEVSEMVDKEVNMPTPTNQMDLEKRWQAKENAVDSIMKHFGYQKGTREYDVKVRGLVSEIEKAQIY